MNSEILQVEYSDEELLKEAMWETEMLRRGRDSYLAALEDKNLADTDIGISLSMQMIPGVVRAIEELQEEYTDILLHGSNSRAKTGGVHLIPLCDANLLGVAVVQHYLRAMMSHDEADITVRSLLDRMEDAYIEAMGLQLWEQDEKEEYALFWKRNADKLSTVGKSTSSRNLIKKRLRDRIVAYYSDFKDQHDTTQHMQLSVATALLSCIGFTKVRKVSEEKAIDVMRTEGEDRVRVIDGDFCLVESEVGAFADMFALVTSTDRSNKEVRTMHFSESAADSIDYTIERRAVGNTSLRPMLVKPKRWILTTS